MYPASAADIMEAEAISQSAAAKSMQSEEMETVVEPASAAEEMEAEAATN